MSLQDQLWITLALIFFHQIPPNYIFNIRSILIIQMPLKKDLYDFNQKNIDFYVDLLT